MCKPAKDKYKDQGEYEASAKKWLEKHNSKPKAKLELVAYLFHSTQKTNLEKIKESGLLPKKPEWGMRDASKDGFLSMSQTDKGAGAMGGNCVLLRVKVDDSIKGDDYDFRVYSATEVRTRTAIPVNKLKQTNDGGKSWVDLANAS